MEIIVLKTVLQDIQKSILRFRIQFLFSIGNKLFRADCFMVRSDVFYTNITFCTFKDCIHQIYSELFFILYFGLIAIALPSDS